MIFKWFLNSAQLKHLNDLRDELVMETLNSLSLLVEYDSMPVSDMFTGEFKKGHTILQKHVLKVYKKRYKKLHKEAKRFKEKPPETPPPPPQDDKQPPKVITADLMQIDDTKQVTAFISNAIKQLGICHSKYPELTEELLEQEEERNDG